jgi:PAS domain-containing protein
MAPITDRPVQDRLGNAVYRLTTLERRAAGAATSPKLAARFADDVRRLAHDLEACYEDARALLAECARLRAAEHSARKRAAFYFERSPTPAVIVDLRGAIVEANDAAVRLLNVSRRHLAGRAFQLYLGSDREQFLAWLHHLQPPHRTARWAGKIRPRERSPLEVRLTVTLDPDGQVMVSIQSGDVTTATGWSEPADPEGAPLFLA